LIDSEVAYECLLLLDGRLRYRFDELVAVGVNTFVFSLLLLILSIGFSFMTGSAFSNVLLLTTVFNFDATVDYISDVIFLLKKWLVVIAVPNLSPSATLSSLPVII
jgi:hypothetical protein